MPNRFFVPGGNNRWNSNDTTNWSATSGGPGGASVPTSSDDVFINASSGTAINFFVGFCRSINCTGFTGQLAWQLGSSPLYVYGDVNFPSSMQVNSPGMFAFAELQFLGTTHNLTANTSLINHNLVLGAGATVNAITPLTFRRIDFSANAVFNSYNNNLSLDFLGPQGANSIMSLGISTVTVRDDWVKTNNLLLFDSGNSTLFVANDFDGGNGTYGTVTITGQQDSTVSLTSPSGRINNTLTINGGGVKSILGGISAGSLNFSGPNANSGRLFIVGQNQQFIQSQSGAATFNNVSFRNINGSNLQTVSGNRSEDCGNVSGIPFTSVSVSSTNSGDWTTGSTWAGGNMPLTQDSAVISSGTDVRWTRGVSGVPLGCVNLSGSGSLNLSGGFALPVSGSLQYSGYMYSGSVDLTGSSASLFVSSSGGVTVTSFANTNINASTQLGTLNILNGGVFNAPVNVGSLLVQGTVNLGNNTHTISTSFTNQATLTATQATLQFPGNVTPVNFSAGNAAYKEVRILGTGGNGVINITGSPEINTLSRTGTESFTLQFPATTTIGQWSVSGDVNKRVVITSNTSVTTLNYSGLDPVNADYLTVSKITGSPANTWYVGSNSVDGGNNTNIFFSPPSKGNSLFFGSNF
jgi:hypothetical protein